MGERWVVVVLVHFVVVCFVVGCLLSLIFQFSFFLMINQDRLPWRDDKNDEYIVVILRVSC